MGVVTRGRETIKDADEEERGPQPRLEDNGECRKANRL